MYATYPPLNFVEYAKALLQIMYCFSFNGNSLSGVAACGAPNIAMYGLPINNIKRIEVVSSPGSALYGTTVVIGVVNIITRDQQDIDGVELSFSTEHESEG